MEISLSSNSITDDHIATKFGTCHDSPAVVPCAKYCSSHFISIWMGAKWNFHHIWIVMERLLVKWAPGPKAEPTLSYCYPSYEPLRHWYFTETIHITEKSRGYFKGSNIHISYVHINVNPGKYRDNMIKRIALRLLQVLPLKHRPKLSNNK